MRRFIIPSLLLFFLASCTPPAPPLTPAKPQLVFLRSDETGRWQLVAQPDLLSPPAPLPVSLQADCLIYRLYPNPVHASLAIEFYCGDQPMVEVVDLSATSTPAASRKYTDARFLSWSADGRFLYLKTNPMGAASVARADWHSNASPTIFSLPAAVYDLAALADGRIIYSTTQGLGFGSQTWLAEADGGRAALIREETSHIIAYLRPSPDSRQIAYIRIPDSPVPFTVGWLGVMDINGENARLLAEADAGHGYAPAWSPNGEQIAFVVRENPDDPAADLAAGALLSNVYRLEVRTGALAAVTSFQDAIVEAPVWSPDGSQLFFTVRRNGTIQVWVDDNGILRPLAEGGSCCAVWAPERE